MIQIEVVHVPEGRSKIIGIYPWVQVTYKTVRVGENGEIELGYENSEGYWEFEGESWTDFIISSATEE